MVEPAVPVQVRIEYENSYDPSRQGLRIVHFAKEENEIIEPEKHSDKNGNVEAVEFAASSFSAYAVISQEASEDVQASYIFTIPDEGACVHFTNDYTVTLPIILKKAGYDNRDGSAWDLPGAVFRIYSNSDKAEEHLVTLGGMTEFTSDENGLLYEGEIGVGTYYLDEITVPDGYNSPQGMFVLKVEPGRMTLSKTGISGTNDLNSWIKTEYTEGTVTYTVTLRNTTGYELPHTGGSGTGIFRMAGILVMAAAALMMKLRRES